MKNKEQTAEDLKTENARDARTIRILMIVFAAMVAVCMVIVMKE